MHTKGFVVPGMLVGVALFSGGITVDTLNEGRTRMGTNQYFQFLNMGAFSIGGWWSEWGANKKEVQPTSRAKVQSAQKSKLQSAQAQKGKSQSPSYQNEIATIERELTSAQKSGAISPTTYKQIDAKLKALENKGANTAKARALLSKLHVGGSEPVQKTEARQEVSGNVPASRKTVSSFVSWEYMRDQNKWVPSGTPPPCPEPLVIESPVDVNLVTNILYPGQVRGLGPNDFKSHGGFTLKPNSKIEIRAPLDGYLTSVAKFTDEFGYHVSLNFEHPCGIKFGGGHWGTVPPDIQAVVDKVPLKAYGDSRTEQIMPPYFVKKGQVIVTGLQEKANPERPGFDWGIADYRQPNSASKDPRFRELYGYAQWNTYYGVCWLDLLPPDQKTILKSLPGGDGKQGKNSEYCK